MNNSLTNKYQEFVREISFYPDKGKNLNYPTLGLVGEFGELYEYLGLDFGATSEDILQEAGDCLFYLFALMNEVGGNFASSYKIYASGLLMSRDPLIYLSDICEVVKKVYRDKDGEINREYQDKICLAIFALYGMLENLCTKYLMDITMLMEMNMKKLISRKERGALKGDGDTR